MFELGICKFCGATDSGVFRLQPCVPTPPASQPTVTLGRETFDRLVAKAESLKSDLLALLRAAEQK